jgi:parallel beta-helix repeat protein
VGVVFGDISRCNEKEWAMKKRLLSSLITGQLVVVCVFVFSGVAAGDTVYVDPNGSADFTTIQAAIDDIGTVAGDVVIVMPGTYVENINMSGKAITLRSTDPLDAGVVLATIIDGNAVGTVIKCNTGEGPSTVISGFLITNGLADYGGGMGNNSSSPKVINCTFSGNTANIIGGGMICDGSSSATITNCTFSDNTADWGGGMCDYSSSTTVNNCTFSNNSAFERGGGFYNHYNSSPTLTNCTFSGNTAAGSGFSIGRGGGMYNNSSSSPTISNCTFSGNTTEVAGGGMFNNASSPTVTDSYFCSNVPDAISGSLHPDSGGNNMEFCPPPRPLEPEYQGDVDGDGDVDFYDLALLAANWLEGI